MISNFRFRVFVIAFNTKVNICTWVNIKRLHLTGSMIWYVLLYFSAIYSIYQHSNFDTSINYLCILFCSVPVNISCLPRRLQDILARRLPQDLFKNMSGKLVLKMSWKTKKCHTKEVFKMSSVRPQHVFTKRNVAWVLIDLSLSKFSTLCAE